MDKKLKLELVNYLKEFVTPERWEKMNRVLDNRTRFFTVVLEDIYQPHNASAVLRSCDCFGIQDVHIIENRNEFDPSKGVTIGADQWITLHRHNRKDTHNSAACYRQLREQGYRLIATTPHHDQVTVEQLPVDQKTALVFGAEYTGLSDYALDHADGYATIPMVGFSESFNISVGAALCMYELTKRLRAASGKWELTGGEKIDLQLEWLRTSIRAADELVNKFVRENQNKETG